MASQIPRAWRLITAKSAPTALNRSLQQPAQSSSRGYATSPGGRGGGEVKFWPFFAVIGLGTAAYIALARRRVSKFLTETILSLSQAKEQKC